MRDGRPRRHVLRFLVVTVAVSLVLGVSLMVISWRTSSAFLFDLAHSMLAMVPAWSMIAAAVGAPRGRKLAFVLGLLAFVLVFDVIAFLTGWQQLATNSTVIEGARNGVLVAAYRLVLVSSPFVAVVLFAGKRPSVFWTNEG